MARGQRAKFEFTTVDKIALIVEVGALVVLAALNIMGMRGLSLIRGEIPWFIALLIPLTLAVWGIYRLIIRLKTPRGKLIAGAVLGMVLMMLFTLAMSLVSVMATMAIPQRYAMVTSPTGKRQLVVMRVLDQEEERMAARREARLAADPEADPETQITDYGYQYLAFPPVLRFFYRSNADVDGLLCLGYGNDTKLMVEWLDDENTAHFFINDPGPGDVGEFTVWLGAQ